MAARQDSKVSRGVELMDFSQLLEQSLDDRGRNNLTLVCGSCKCKILGPLGGSMIEKKMSLPSMTERYVSGTSPAKDTLLKHWIVRDMFDFENVGFSKPVDNFKYLICADCEMGPIGWQDTSNNKEFFVACERVKYIETS